MYNSSHKVYQFCNGTDWIAMLGAQGPPGPAGDGVWLDGASAGDIHYSSGNVGIGTTDPDTHLHIAKPGGGLLHLQDTNNAGAAAVAWIGFYDSGKTRTGYVGDGGGGTSDTFLVSDNGSVQLGANNGTGVLIDAPTNCWLGTGTGATNCTSDIRLKQNVEPVSGALDKVLALEGVTFEWKTTPGVRRLGLIAQDVQQVFPEAVMQDEEGYLGISHGVLVAPLIEAVKQLKAENNELRAELETIRSRLDAGE